MLKRGFTLHELLISLTVMSGVIALAAHFAVGQTRLLTGLSAAGELRAQLAQANGILANVLWGISPAAGDLLAAQDSAIELRMPIGTAVVCSGSAGVAVIAAPTRDTGSVFSAFAKAPGRGDLVAAFVPDSLGARWLTLRLSAAPVVAGACPSLAAPRAWTLTFVEPLTLVSGTVLRLSRPIRFSLYRASDGRWYLGARDWNDADARFNAIQPVAGPLAPYAGGEGSGFRLVYRDADGVLLDEPVDPSRVASVTITTVGATMGAVRVGGLPGGWGTAYRDSASLTVSPRNR